MADYTLRDVQIARKLKPKVCFEVVLLERSQKGTSLTQVQDGTIVDTVPEAIKLVEDWLNG